MNVRPRLLAVVGVATIGFACGPTATEVSTVGVEAGEVVRTVAAPAVVDAVASVEIRAPVAGTVAELAVTDGATVTAGQSLVVLVSDSVELQLAQAQAALDAADALVRAAGSLTGDVSPLIGALRVQLETTFPAVITGLEGQLAVAESTSGLLDAQGRAAVRDARQQLEEIEAGFAQAQQDLEALESDARRQAAQTSGFQRSVALAQRRQAELALEAAQSRADRLTVIAPIPGLVVFGDRQQQQPSTLDLESLGAGAAGALGGLAGIDVGGLLGAAGGPSVSGLPLAVDAEVGAGETLLTIYDLSQMVVRLDVDELDIVELAIGQHVVVRVDALSGAQLTGTVAAISPTPQRRSSLGATYAVTVMLDPIGDVPLRIGMTAAAEIEVERRMGEITVPTGALLRRGDADVVRVLSGATVRDIAVDVVLLGDERAIISGSVTVGDRVIVGGLAEVSDGDRARDLAVSP